MISQLYLVRDINSLIHEYSFSEIWCNDYFNDALKCILMPPQDLEKVDDFNPEKKICKTMNILMQKIVVWGIGELVN